MTDIELLQSTVLSAVHSAVAIGHADFMSNELRARILQVIEETDGISCLRDPFPVYMEKLLNRLDELKAGDRLH